LLDPSTAVPLYHQLKELLREQILGNTWPPGARIPSETQLCARYGISRITVRQALDDLVTEGWLYRERGRGTFVRSAEPEIGLSPLFMLQRIASFPGPPEHRPLWTRTVAASASVRRSLGLSRGERVLQIARIRLVNGKPVAFEVGHIPRALLHRLPTPEETRSSFFYDILRAASGVEPAHTRITLEAVLVGAQEARFLEARVGSPAIRLQRLTSSRTGRPVLLTHNIMAGEHRRYVFHLDVPRPGSVAPLPAEPPSRR
jgi:GntR family transcriptional regulator